MGKDASAKNQTKIVLFCGGRGSATITHELLRWPNIHLTLIVNAYDDGLSTGALRNCIAQMLGPSDFRKNLTYLLDPYSEEQYALKSLLELRLPESIKDKDVSKLQECIKTENLTQLAEPMRSLFIQIGSKLSKRLCFFLNIFFNYTKEVDLEFDYSDCSIGNLIFAGAYIKNNHNFNATTKELSQMVGSQALLVNVSTGENRILVGLKEDGTLLATEAELVGSQSNIPIRAIFLVEKPISLEEWDGLKEQSIEEKESWLRAQERVPEASPEAENALAEADIILFGPGTQHSSLLPSYKIIQHSLKKSPALVKAFIMNLDPDHDIQSLSTTDIVDRALYYMGDSQNYGQLITHILLNKTSTLDTNNLLNLKNYKNCSIIIKEFMNNFMEKIHNGRAVVETSLELWEKTKHLNTPNTLNIFLDIHKRSLALTELHEELLEVDWKRYFDQVCLTINKPPMHTLALTEGISIKSAAINGHFPEIDYFFNWLNNEKSEYLMLITGDGSYRFRNVMLAVSLLEQSHFGAVFGSRNQSRLQFQTSLRSAYGEKKILRTFSFLGSFLISAMFALRFGILFSDPLTGFRLFKRSKLTALDKNMVPTTIKTSIGLAIYLMKHNIEIAELPVSYRTYSGFVDPKWRINRGIKNLFSTLRKQPS